MLNIVCKAYFCALKINLELKQMQTNKDFLCEIQIIFEIDKQKINRSKIMIEMYWKMEKKYLWNRYELKIIINTHVCLQNIGFNVKYIQNGYFRLKYIKR